jgi:AcrR family transcriptional regulator
VGRLLGRKTGTESEREFRFRFAKIRNLDSGYKWGYPHSMTPPPAATIPAPLKPLRADARRNRERILKAARKVFADQGMHSQIDDVARRAKVGVGTVYRHFPTKEALLDALVREHFEEIAGFAREALGREDAWDGFCELIWRAAGHNAQDLAFCEAIASSDKSAIIEEVGLMGSTRELIARAQRLGRMRTDATVEDVALIMIGASAVMRSQPGAWRRYVALMLDGLRAS